MNSCHIYLIQIYELSNQYIYTYRYMEHVSIYLHFVNKETTKFKQQQQQLLKKYQWKRNIYIRICTYVFCVEMTKWTIGNDKPIL